MTSKDRGRHHQLAQINIALAKDDMDSKIMSDFVNRLDEINELAEQAEGFIWRLKSEDGDSTSIRVFDNPLLLINMSTWDNLDNLQNYVYKSNHVELIRDSTAWFDKMKEMHQALWWIPADHIPTIQEGKDKLDFLRKNEPTKEAFTFAKNFPPSKK